MAESRPAKAALCGAADLVFLLLIALHRHRPCCEPLTHPPIAADAWPPYRGPRRALAAVPPCAQKEGLHVCQTPHPSGEQEGAVPDDNWRRQSLEISGRAFYRSHGAHSATPDEVDCFRRTTHKRGLLTRAA